MDTRPDTGGTDPTNAIRQWRHSNDGRQKEISEACAYRSNEPSMTIQSMAEEADLNTIMKRYASTGVLPQTTRIPQYGDFSEITDYRGALDAVRRAQEDFMRLPAEVRSRFQNDPQQLLEFVSDDRNTEEAKKLGLVDTPEAPTPPIGALQNQPPNTNKV